MPCACQNGKNTKLVLKYTPDIWGPLLWKLLHLLASKLGGSDPLLKTDMANTIHIIVTKLPTILPCSDCQNHARSYLLTNKFDPRNREDMREYTENYLFQFHNTVRTMLGKPLIFTSLAEVRACYATQSFSKTDTTNLSEYLASGVQFRIVNREALSMWNTQISRLRSLVGV